MIHHSIKHFQDSATEAVDRYPDICPHCHQGIVPAYLYGFKGERTVILSFYCTLYSCSEFFVAEYEYSNSIDGWRLINTLLGYPKLTSFSDRIKAVSPLFSKIFNQAEIAQNERLGEVCGMGYRKALEFLIKDYIVFKGIQEESIVKNKYLGDCIEHYIEHPRIKSIAKRAAWLGNDESHYVRKWENMDVEHLKQLISLTISWIEMEIQSDELTLAMPIPEKT